MMNAASNHYPRTTLALATLLPLLTIALFWPATTHDFVHYDDPLYVTSNPVVQTGLTTDGVRWAFGRLVGNSTYWHPVTWLSHMIDCDFFELKPGPHHAVSVLLHAVNTAVLFLLLVRMTGAHWRSAITAAIFAWHPLQVDTVAWIAERKNLLGTLFGLAALWAYLKHVKGARITGKPQSPPQFEPACRISRFYVIALSLFALALMSKSPAMVTFPCVLLLIDLWPLRRGAGVPQDQGDPMAATNRVGSLVCEKIPFFVLAAISSIITFLAHQKLNLVISGDQLPPGTRLINGFVAEARFLGKVFWPANLSVFYPPEVFSFWIQASAVFVVIALSVLACLSLRRLPFLFVGWFWFAGTLVPFAGFVQAGLQSIADRFVYWPIIGLAMCSVWGAGVLLEAERLRWARLVLGVVVLVACAVVSRIQLAHWQNTITLFSHAATVTRNNVVAHINLGSALHEAGEIDRAAEQYRTAIGINPGCIEAVYLLGRLWDSQGRVEEAASQYRAVLHLDPRHAGAHIDLSVLLMNSGRADEAVEQLTLALHVCGESAEAHYNLAIALSLQKNPDTAISHYLHAVKIRPDYADAHNNLGIALAGKGDLTGAAEHLLKSVHLRPADAEAHYNLSQVLAKLGRSGEATRHRETALRLRPDLLKK